MRPLSETTKLILQFNAEGHSRKAIREMLKQRGINVSEQAISNAIRRYSGDKTGLELNTKLNTNISVDNDTPIPSIYSAMDTTPKNYLAFTIGNMVLGCIESLQHVVRQAERNFKNKSLNKAELIHRANVQNLLNHIDMERIAHEKL